jgi:hypothetical protein
MHHPEIAEGAEELSADKGYDSADNKAQLYDDHGIKPVIDNRNLWKEDPDEPRLLFPERADVFLESEKAQVLPTYFWKAKKLRSFATAPRCGGARMSCGSWPSSASKRIATRSSTAARRLTTGSSVQAASSAKPTRPLATQGSCENEFEAPRPPRRPARKERGGRIPRGF